MLGFMRKHGIIRLAALAMLASLLGGALAACGSGGGVVIQQRAQTFVGGALSNFGGIDADVSAARSVARDVAIAREFDFIQPGFTVGAGAISAATAAASQSFGSATGQLTVVGDTATAELTVESREVDVSDVTMTGTFSLSQAQAAVADSGRSFTVTWEFEFTAGVIPVDIIAEQTLSGSGWVGL
jgi:hypothetical protein